ncbi:MAG: OmpH family outer membrane protein [Legionellales bacterium]|nr:OmpH family outer membrane protein [Legionellales bacterium]
MKKLMIIAVSAMALICGTSFATEATPAVKVGVVNVQEILQKAPEAQKMNAELEKTFKPRQDKMEALNKKVLEERDNLSRNSSVMSEKQRTQAQNQLLENQNQLRQMAQKYQDDLVQARNQDMQKLFEVVRDAVQKVAKADNLNIVFEAHSIAYVAPQLDITNQVVKEIK